MPTRGEIQKLYVRVCRDARFKVEPADAAHLAGAVLGIPAMDVWLKGGMDIDTMTRIANGTHPVVTNEALYAP